jgi:hypothetical protein
VRALTRRELHREMAHAARGARDQHPSAQQHAAETQRAQRRQSGDRQGGRVTEGYPIRQGRRARGGHGDPFGPAGLVNQRHDARPDDARSAADRSSEAPMWGSSMIAKGEDHGSPHACGQPGRVVRVPSHLVRGAPGLVGHGGGCDAEHASARRSLRSGSIWTVCLAERLNNSLALLADETRRMPGRHRTVERHITNLYTKIGARSKADATAYAFRHDLT